VGAANTGEPCVLVAARQKNGVCHAHTSQIVVLCGASSPVVPGMWVLHLHWCCCPELGAALQRQLQTTVMVRVGGLPLQYRCAELCWRLCGVPAKLTCAVAFCAVTSFPTALAWFGGSACTTKNGRAAQIHPRRHGILPASR